MKYRYPSVYKCFLVLILTSLLFICVWPPQTAYAATRIDIYGPTGSGSFGYFVTVLANGNFVVVDPGYDLGATADVGAVYLYDEATGGLISTLTGSTSGDGVGNGGITALSNGNFVISSATWDQTSPATTDVGAVTWCSGVSGCSGEISSANSLVGSTDSDQVGSTGIIELSNGNYVVSSLPWDQTAPATMDVGAVTWCSGVSGCSGEISSANSLVGRTARDSVSYGGIVTLNNGNYVVSSQYWNNGATTNAGAVTWCSGVSGCSGEVSSANSLVGSTTDDWIGYGGVTALSNGNYVVNTATWNQISPATTDVGAVTWCNGVSGCSGDVSSANSLIGRTPMDWVGYGGVTALSNGNYVVSSPSWDQTSPSRMDAGAVTWCSGVSGCSGGVSSANSLVGSLADDQVGSSSATALSNGNYAVRSPYWDQTSPTRIDVGAVTWCSGEGGCSGEVSSANSLVGSSANDGIGSGGVSALSNGNYVVSSPSWDQTSSATVDVGAVTWCSGEGGCSGEVSNANSLVGSTANDGVGNGSLVALSNGNYVVSSPYWDQVTLSTVDVGAVTWCSGVSGCSGEVSSANSLVGSTDSDGVGSGGVTALSNGNYVVSSSYWDQPALATMDVGAVTWCSGEGGCSGEVSNANSLVGSTSSDGVGRDGITPLRNGNYVVSSSYWDQISPATTDVGAVTWCSGVSGCSGEVSSANSLVGSTENDGVGNGGVTSLSNGNYVVSSSYWDQISPATTDVGAVTLGAGYAGATVGPITADNSVFGVTAFSGYFLVYAYDIVNGYLLAGGPAENRVSLFRPTYTSLANGNWTAGVNWDYGAFTQSVDVVINGHTLDLNTSAALHSLTIQPGGKLSIPLGESLTVETTLLNHGTLEQTLPVTGSVDSVAFLEIRDAAGTAVVYRGLEITTTNILSNVVASVRELNSGEYCTQDAASPVYANRCYQIIPENDGSATLRLYARTADELNGIAEDNLAIYRFTTGWSELLDNPVTGNDGGAYSYAQADAPGFSSFLLANTGDAPTAVRLIGFRAVRAGQLSSETTVFLALGVALLLAAMIGVGSRRLRKRMHSPELFKEQEEHSR